MTELQQARQALAPYRKAISVLAAGDVPDSDELCRQLQLPEYGLTLFCAANEPNAILLLQLAADVVRRTLQTSPESETEEARWRRRLTGAWNAEDEQRNPLPPGNRCVLVLQARAGSLPEDFRELVPIRRQDALVILDRQSAALVKTLPPSEGVAELLDFACALRETFLEETGRDLVAGVAEIGVPLPKGFDEARQAVSLGLRYDSGQSVWRWDRLIVQRMLDDLPPDKTQGYIRQLFNLNSVRVLDRELLDTAEIFIRNNLNLSDTARQLFIHRSTLMYRLDKLQKATGFDLRLFDDAMTFRLLHLLMQGRGDGQPPVISVT